MKNHGLWRSLAHPLCGYKLNNSVNWTRLYRLIDGQTISKPYDFSSITTCEYVDHSERCVSLIHTQEQGVAHTS